MLIERNGTTLGYDDEGRGAPVVLLHAFPLSRSMWRATIDALRDRYRVIAPDLPGLGESGAPASAAQGNPEDREVPAATPMSAMSDAVVELLDALEIDRAIIGGLSMGGYVTLDLLRRHPERVAGLILADTRPGADSDEGKQNRVALARKALEQGSGAIAEQMLPKLLSEHALAEQPDVVAAARAMIEANSPAGIAAASLGMATRVDSTPILPQVSVPTLVLVGAEDALTPPSEARAMAQAIPQASLAILAGAGHLSNLEQPADFNQALRDFLDGLA